MPLGSTTIVAGGSRKAPGVTLHRARGARVERPMGTVTGTCSDASLVCGDRDAHAPARREEVWRNTVGYIGVAHRWDVRPNMSDVRAYNVVILPRWRVPGTPGTGGVGPEGPDPAPSVKGQKAPKGTQTGQQPRLLDLLSGTWSVGNVFAYEGYEVVSVDINPRFHPTVVTDIMEWDHRAAYPVGYSDVIFACPPCEQLIQARTTAPRDLVEVE